MFSHNSSNKNSYLLLISLLTLVTFLTLYIFRAVDDNRLTSWLWAFEGVDITLILLIFVVGIIFAYFAAKSSFPERKPVLFLFSTAFAVSMFFWREPEVIIDASRYFTQAKHLEIYGIRYFISEWGRDIKAWTDLPLVPFLFGLVFKFFGESRIHIQIFTTSLFSLTAVLTYLIGKTLWDKNTGFFAALLLLGMPYLFTQVPLMLVDIPTMFFLTLLIFVFIKALSQGGVWMIVCASASLFLTIFSKYSAWLMLSVLVVISMVYVIEGIKGSRHRPVQLRPPFGETSRRGERVLLKAERQNPEGRIQGTDVRPGNYTYRAAIVMLIGGIFTGIVILYKLDVISEQVNLLITYQKPGLRRWGEGFISTFFYQIHPFITIASLYSVYVAFKKRDLKYLIILWLVLLVVVLQIKRIRYILIILPMLALMASYGLQAIRDKEIRRFVASCIVVSSFIVAIFIYLPFLQKMSSVNLKNAGRFLNAIKAENIEVVTIPSVNHLVNPAVSVPILDMFTEKDIYYQYDSGSSPPFETIKKSPLRFTWEYKNPEYYTKRKGSEGDKVIVVISSELEQSLPNYIAERIKGFQISKIFGTSIRVFRYATIVRIYHQEQDTL